MAKGYRGESCAEAVRTSFGTEEVLRVSELFARVRKRGPWTPATIWQHLMAVVVNLPPARHHFANVEPFLFLRPDGQYEIYDQAKHPRVIE